jgi:preprotein translocase subunit SecG
LRVLVPTGIPPSGASAPRRWCTPKEKLVTATAAATSTASTALVASTGISPLVYLLVAIHVLLGIGLIVFVLLHSGKGTGLSSLFGGMSSSATGTSIIEKNLDRITIGLAVGWALTSLILMMVYRPS